jgi:hypothetical protein
VAALAAQTPGTTTDDKKVTVTGCLQDGSATPGATSAAGSFVLANAMMGGSMTSAGSTAGATATPPPATSTTGTTGTTGTTAESARSASHTSYALDGSDSDLKKHVGHKIEVTGTIVPPSAASSSATSTTAAASASSSMTPERLKVSSVRMISADCSSR